jgi:predicted nucleotidyltransferase
MINHNNSPFINLIEKHLNNQNIGLYKPKRWFYMITEKQLKFFEVLAKKPFIEHTRTEIKKESKDKSNNALALAINLLKKEEVLNERKIGKSGLLTLNLDNELTYQYLALCNNKRVKQAIASPIKKIITGLNEVTNFYSLVIFGSYSSCEEKKSSDLDVAIFIEEEGKKKKIIAALNSANLKSLIEIDAHVITKNEMREMLASDEENLGKQIARKHLAIYNHRIFYELVKEGIKHGFRA